MLSKDVELFRMLVEAGAQPGQDFSYDLERGSCHINERGFILLQNAFPHIDWHDIANLVERDMDAPVVALSQHLGVVNFAASVMESLERRLQVLPTNEAAWYVHQILGGIEARTGIALYQLIQRDSSHELCQQVDQLLGLTPITPCNVWIEDLVLAAGGTLEDVDYAGQEVLLSEAGVQLLTQVWAGELDVQDEMAA
ncbi:MAG: hypothetical protein AAFY17_14565 [Cyanobacteria bacterium J06642_11]